MLKTEAVDDLALFCRKPPPGWQVVYVDETASTNIIAMEQGRQGALAHTIIVANSQTEGRGRLGKEWQSYPGCGLYVSIILRPKLELAHLARITLAAGVALAETTACFSRVKPMLKWPNDLVLQGQKCGGILAESDIRNSHSPLVILGVGVNIQAPTGGYAPDLRVKAGSITDFSDGCTRVAFLKKLIPAVRRVVVDLEEGRFQDIIRRWRLYDYTMGKQLVWLTTGGQVVEGICGGINDDGLLFITDSGGNTHQVLSGDVQLAERVE